MSIKLFAFLAALGSAFADNTTTTTTDAATTTTTTAASNSNATTTTASTATTTTTTAATATATTTAATYTTSGSASCNMVVPAGANSSSLMADSAFKNATCQAVSQAANLDASRCSITGFTITNRRQLEESAEARQLQTANKNVKTKYDITAADSTQATARKNAVAGVTAAALKSAMQTTLAEMDLSASSVFSSVPTVNSAQAPTASVLTNGQAQQAGGGSGGGATTSGAVATVVYSGAVLAAVALMM